MTPDPDQEMDQFLGKMSKVIYWMMWSWVVVMVLTGIGLAFALCALGFMILR